MHNTYPLRIVGYKNIPVNLGGAPKAIQIVARSAASFSARNFYLARNVSDTLRERFGRTSSGGATGITRSRIMSATTTAAPSLFFPPSRPVFPFPVHWPGLGVDRGLDYCHPLLIHHWPGLGVDRGLDHGHQP